MGVISILLGIIAFLGFTSAGALLANVLIDQKVKFSTTFTALANISNTSILAVVIGVFGVIGLLICVSMVVQGLTYNKVSKLYKMANRSKRK